MGSYLSEYLYRAIQEPRMTTPNERERVNTLCRRIQVEYDPEAFSKLCKELNKLLDVDEQNAKATEWNQARIERLARPQEFPYLRITVCRVSNNAQFPAILRYPFPSTSGCPPAVLKIASANCAP